MKTMAVPAWIMEHPGERFLLGLTPDGRVILDGGHTTPAEVAKAQHLFGQIACIRPPEGTRYVMVAIADVPPFKGRVNESAITTLNAAARPDREPRT